jgi:hypothetical protein
MAAAPFATTDELLSELKASVEAYSWDLTGPDAGGDDSLSAGAGTVSANAAGIGSGNAVFLSDLGSVLYAAHCCIGAAAAAVDGVAGSSEDELGAPNNRLGSHEVCPALCKAIT